MADQNVPTTLAARVGVKGLQLQLILYMRKLVHQLIIFGENWMVGFSKNLLINVYFEFLMCWANCSSQYLRLANSLT